MAVSSCAVASLLSLRVIKYQKKQPDESFITMTAYEVSISKLAAFDDEADFDIDEEFDLYSAPHAYQNND